MKLLSKQIDHHSNKDVYLLGEDSDGIRYWLEAPSWDCDWYWGFGYIETYQANRLPSEARDISSHSHADNFMAEYFTEWNSSKPILTSTTFDEKEGWELSELFSQFYHLREQTEFWGRGKKNVANTTIKSWEDKTLAAKINDEMLPVIMGRIIQILSPDNKIPIIKK